jgi:hypothetical protein
VEYDFWNNRILQGFEAFSTRKTQKPNEISGLARIFTTKTQRHKEEWITIVESLVDAFIAMDSLLLRTSTLN